MSDGLLNREDDEADTFCVVCGVPLHVPEPLESIERYKWLQDAVAIRAPYVEQSHVCKKYRRYHGHGNPMQIFPAKEVVRFYQDDGTIGPIENNLLHLEFDNGDNNTWIGMHRKCLDMMQQLLNYRNDVLRLFNNNAPIYSRSNSPAIDKIVPIHEQDVLLTPTNLGEMYEVYHYRIRRPGARAAGIGPLEGYCMLKLMDPHEYYYNLLHNNVWEFGAPRFLEYEAAPSPIPDLLPQILAYLQPLPPTTATTATTTSMQQFKWSQLPPELQHTIFKSLHPFTNPTVRCSRHLTPLVWRSLLFYGRLLPWLWELPEAVVGLASVNVSLNGCGNGNRIVVNVKLDDDDNSQSWDWELLVRQLAQPDVFNPGGVMESAPLALRNRRRIWRLLDEARVGDISKYEDKRSISYIWEQQAREQEDRQIT